MYLQQTVRGYKYLVLENLLYRIATNNYVNNKKAIKKSMFHNKKAENILKNRKISIVKSKILNNRPINSSIVITENKYN